MWDWQLAQLQEPQTIGQSLNAFDPIRRFAVQRADLGRTAMHNVDASSVSTCAVYPIQRRSDQLFHGNQRLPHEVESSCKILEGLRTNAEGSRVQ